MKSSITVKECLLHALLLLVLIAILLPGVFLRKEATLPGDLLYRYDPWKQNKPADLVIPSNDSVFDYLTSFNADYMLVSKALRAGEWPLWNPMEYTGMPLMANYQSTVFYPPRLVFSFLEHYTAGTIFFILKMWLCGMTAYLCGRGLGLGRPAARFLSIAWMLGAYNILWYYYPLPDVSAWIPLLFLGVEWTLAGRLRKGFWMIALGGALILLAGHPESAFAMGLGLGFYFMVRLLADRHRGKALWSRMGVALGAWVLALAVCAVQLVPFIEYVFNSHTFLGRQGSDLRIQVLQPSALVSFWVPRFYGAYADGTFWGWPADASVSAILNIIRPNSSYVSLIYPGVAVWVALSMLFVREGRTRRLWMVLLAVLVTAFMGILLATKSPVLGYIHRIPFFSAMWPAYYVGFGAFALPVLGALGIEHWCARPRRGRDLWRTAPVFILACVVIVAVYAVNRETIQEAGLGPSILRQVGLFLVLFVAGVAVLASHLYVKRPGVVINLFVILLTVDLLIAARGVNSTTPREHLFPQTEFTEKLRPIAEEGRLSLVGTDLPPGIAQVYGVEQLWGHDGIIPYRIMEYILILNPCAWDVMEPVCAVSHYLFRSESIPALASNEKFELVLESEGYGIFRNRHAFDRAFLVGSLEVEENRDALFDRMCAPGFDPARVALTESPPPGEWPTEAGGSLGTAAVIERGMNDAVVEVSARRRAVLVLSDAFYPGWRAYVDGERSPIFPVYFAFRGVIVPEGDHTVTFRYEPMSFKVGLGISVAALLIAGAVCLYFLRPGRPRRVD